MAVFTYLDCSGDATDPAIKVISVGGFIAHENAWEHFEEHWPLVLKEFGVTELHMRKFTSGKGEFAPWKDDKARRAEFMRAVTEIIRHGGKEPIGATLPLGVYRLFNRDYCLAEAVGKPYTVALLNAIALAQEWKERNGITEPMIVYIEKGDNEQDDWNRYSTKRIVWEPDFLKPIVVPKSVRDPMTQEIISRVLPFQACDFISYEQAKAITDLMDKGKRDLRKSLRQAMQPDPAKSYWKLLESQMLNTYIARAGVPRRFNHFVGGTEARRTRFLDPLWFVNGRPVVSYVAKTGYLDEREQTEDL